MLYLIAGILFAVWLLGLLFGKGGFLHILILVAVSIALVQWAARRRAAQG